MNDNAFFCTHVIYFSLLILQWYILMKINKHKSCFLTEVERNQEDYSFLTSTSVLSRTVFLWLTTCQLHRNWLVPWAHEDILLLCMAGSSFFLSLRVNASSERPSLITPIENRLYLFYFLSQFPFLYRVTIVCNYLAYWLVYYPPLPLESKYQLLRGELDICLNHCLPGPAWESGNGTQKIFVKWVH